ncbi:hypothetical protein M413DRAFT_443990 [Hebeloma cylindrosporum]|uniref:Uncharacterized protein n=1 Tax=Hebeloma cylindrosporum TaxID=76867 RepID=A0A0C2Y014_HEBCY|nr:hypothetical protein M413DRAFT_443990 [Hebeloma cylindrosporum h7]
MMTPELGGKLGAPPGVTVITTFFVLPRFSVCSGHTEMYPRKGSRLDLELQNPEGS